MHQQYGVACEGTSNHKHKRRSLTLRDVTKQPVKMPSVPNPYVKTRVGISKFVVPRASIPHRPPTQRVWAMTTPTQRTPHVPIKDKGAASLVINGGDDSNIVIIGRGEPTTPPQKRCKACYRSRKWRRQTSKDTGSHHVTTYCGRSTETMYTATMEPT